MEKKDPVRSADSDSEQNYGICASATQPNTTSIERLETRARHTTTAVVLFKYLGACATHPWLGPKSTIVVDAVSD